MSKQKEQQLQQLSSSDNIYSDDYLNSLVKFIPVSVLYYLSQTPPDKRRLPHCQQFNSAVMIAEIKNFYNQENRYKNFQSDQQYNEHLASMSNKFLDIMTKTIHKYGGDVIQFLGNSLIAVWPRKALGVNNKEEENDITVARKATQCGLEIKNELKKLTSTISNAIAATKGNLDQQNEIFMGVGFGNCGILHVGGVFKRVEYVLIGEGLSSALKALRLATSEQSLVISWNLWNMVDEHFVCEPIHNMLENEKAVSTYFGTPLKIQYNTLYLRSQIPEKIIRELELDLKTYIPAAYRTYIKQKKDFYGNENRRVTIMVLNLEMEYEVSSTSVFSIIQKVITIIQQQVYRMEGSFNKVISYDGGLTVLCSWGISPMSHEDDATRACLAALSIQRLIHYFTKIVAGLDFNPPIHIGICSGHTFMGVVGEGSRKEIVMLGDVVERAFLFMQTATKYYGKIFVDYDTKMEASHFIDFNYIEHVEFAHKYINQPLFEPIDPTTNDHIDPNFTRKDILKLIRLHSNPFKVDYRNIYQHNFAQIYGQHNAISQILDGISKYVISYDEEVWVIAIKGQEGSGKSLFARNLLSQVIQKEKEILSERNTDLEKKGLQPTCQFYFMVSSCNAEISKRFLGIWLPILREFLKAFGLETKKKPESILNALIKDSDIQDKIDIIEDIFSVRGLIRKQTQIRLMEDPIGFAKNQSYPINIEESIIQFLSDFVNTVVQSTKKDKVFFILLDNVSLMDKASWRLFELIQDDCESMILLMCIQSESVELPGNGLNFVVSENAYKLYQDRLSDRERQIFNVVEIEALTEYDFRQVLIDQAPQYEQDMQQEITDMTNIIYRNNSIKTLSTQDELRTRLIKKFQCYGYFKDVEKEVIQEINDFLTIKDQFLLSTYKIRQCFKIKCWNNIQIPPYIIKGNCCLVERAFLGREKYNKLSREMNLACLLLLKLASVIGEIFTLNQVKAIFQYEDLNQYSAELLLSELEIRGLIELIYEDSIDVYYRFETPFLRETLFQLQIYQSQRKPIHSKVIAYLQENMVHNWQTGWDFEQEQALLLQHLLDEQGVQYERQLSAKGRQALIIKRVNAQLLQKKHYLKIGRVQILKRPTNDFVERFFAISQKSLTWYENENAFKVKRDKGEAYLDQISRVTQMKSLSSLDSTLNDTVNSTKRSFPLQIICNEWIKENKTMQRQKVIVIVFQSRRECQDWAGYIEYLKTKASLDLFMNKFGRISFPGTTTIAGATPSPLHSTTPQSKDIYFLIFYIDKITHKPDSRFGQGLQRQIFNSQQNNLITNSSTVKTFASAVTIRKRKQMKLLPNEQNDMLTVESLKDKLKDLYNIVKLKFIQHMTINSCKYDEEYDEVEVSDLRHIPEEMEAMEEITKKYIQKKEEIEEEEEIIGDLSEEEKDQFDLDENSEPDQKEFTITDANNPLGNEKLNKKDIRELRRLTKWDVNDPNQFQLLQVTQLKKFGLHRLTTLRKTNHLDISLVQSDINEITLEGESFYDALFYYFEDNPYFKQHKVALPITQYPFNEGLEMLQYKSVRNDINTKQVNIKRRRKANPNQLLLSVIENTQQDLTQHNLIGPGESFSQDVYQLSATKQDEQNSIKKQIYKSKDAQRQNKAHSLAKVLEQGHRPNNQRGKPTTKKNIEQLRKKKLQLNKEQEDSQQEEQTGNSILTSNYSVSYLQTIKEANENGQIKTDQKGKHRRHKSKHQNKHNKKKHIYRPVSSQKELIDWEKDEKQIVKNIHYSDNEENQEDPYYDEDNESSYYEELNRSRYINLDSLSDNINKYVVLYRQFQEVVVVQEVTQCIVLNPVGSQIKLKIGDRVVIEKDLPDLNLVQCKYSKANVKYTLFIPRESIEKIESYMESSVNEDSNVQNLPLQREPTNVPRARAIEISINMPTEQDEDFHKDQGHLSENHFHIDGNFDTFNNQTYQQIKQDSNEEQQEVIETPQSSQSNQRGMLKLKERREKKMKEMALAEKIGSTLAQTAVKQGLSLKMMERRMKKVQLTEKQEIKPQNKIEIDQMQNDEINTEMIVGGMKEYYYQVRQDDLHDVSVGKFDENIEDSQFHQQSRGQIK